MEGFCVEGYELISELIEEKMPLLRKNKDFNQMYVRLSDAIDELEDVLPENQKKLFGEIIQLFFKTEEYYFALAYSLGVKYGIELKKL